MKDGWIQNDERRVLMDDRLLGHRAFTDLSFTQKNILTIQLRPSTLLYFISVLSEQRNPNDKDKDHLVR